MQFTAESSSPGTSCTLVQVQRRLGTFRGFAMTQKENGMSLRDKSRKQILYKKTSSPEWMQKTSEKTTSWSGMAKNTHFNAGSVSHTMIVDLISSAKDICMLYGICYFLGRIKQDDLESRQDSASIVLTPRVSENACLSRASVAVDLSDYAWLAEGHLSARASTVETDQVAMIARAAEGNLRLIPNKETTEAVVKRANVAKDKELIRLGNIADYAGTLKIRQYLQKKSPARNSSGKFCTPCGEVDRPTNSKDGRLLQRISPWGRTRPIWNKNILDTEGCSGIDANVPSTENPNMLLWVNACTDEVRNCRQMAVTNTIILNENPGKETSESSGQASAKGVTLKAEGDSEQETQPF